MSCCCKPGTSKMSAACLGRCDLPKHRCLDREEVQPGPVPPNMGWLYNAKDSPSHQLRCGWRPGHISCSVLRKIEAQKCGQCDGCNPCGPCPTGSPSCTTVCTNAPPCKSTISPANCVAMFANTSCPKKPCCQIQPLIRVIRHNGQYSICTKPSNISNAPSGPYPLKYVLNTEDSDDVNEATKFSIEAKYNDYRFDYTSSQCSFVIDFTPPENFCN